MSIDWIPYPRPGTSVLPGRWLVTAQDKFRTIVDFAHLFPNGKWYTKGGSLIHEGIIAIAHVPEPYTPPS